MPFEDKPTKYMVEKLIKYAIYLSVSLIFMVLSNIDIKQDVVNVSDDSQEAELVLHRESTMCDFYAYMMDQAECRPVANSIVNLTETTKDCQNKKIRVMFRQFLLKEHSNKDVKVDQNSRFVRGELPLYLFMFDRCGFFIYNFHRVRI